VLNSDLSVFDVRPATLWRLRQRPWSAGQKKFTGKNPPEGALLTYYLKDAVPPETPKEDSDEKDAAATPPKKEGNVKITISDKDGKLVREMDGPGAAGVNRVNWDLRYNAADEPTPEQRQAMEAGYAFGPRGPLVEPGEYTIKVKAGAKEATQKAVVEEDTRVSISAADRAARHEAIMKLYELAKTTAKDRKTITGLKEALTTARDQWKKNAATPGETKIPEDIRKAAEELQKKVDALEEKFVRPQQGLGNAGPPLEWKPDPLPNRAQELIGDLDGFVAAPGGQQKERIAELETLVAQASTEVKKLVDEDLAALNKKMNEAGIPHIVPSSAPQRRGPSDDGESER